MNFGYGTLESRILTALWELEESGIYKHSVKDVYDFINKKGEEKRAYTTIKTVMDRMFIKEALLRVKQGNKFYYRTAYSYHDVVKSSLENIASQYCNGDLKKLLKTMQGVIETKDVTSKIQ